MGRKITISFKNTKKDKALYDYIMALDDKSHDIKSILYKEFKINNIDNTSGTYTKKTKENDIENIDFSAINITK